MANCLTILLLVALSGCQSGGTAASQEQGNIATTHTLETSTWGSGAETLSVGPEGARFEGQCLEGTIEPITVDGRGGFDVAGTLRRAGGARLDADEATAVRYRGRIAGARMELTIVRDGKTVVGSTLQKGKKGLSKPCA